MKYEPLTPEKFIEKLKAGQYDSLTGARRAVGKAAWDETKRDKARKAAEAHFGTEGSPAAKKPAAKKAAAAPKAAPVKRAAVMKSAPVRQPVTRARAPQQHADPEVASTNIGHIPSMNRSLTARDIKNNPFQTVQLAEHAVQSGTAVLNSLTEAKKQHPSLEVTAAHDQAVSTVQGGLKLIANVLDKLSEGMNIPEAIKEASRPINGTTIADEHLVPGITQYQAPSAEA